MVRRSRSIARGKNFVAAGWGKFGPYITATRRLSGRTYGKISFGTQGFKAGIKHSGRRYSTQGMYNITTGKPSFSVKRKRRRRRSSRRR